MSQFLRSFESHSKAIAVALCNLRLFAVCCILANASSFAQQKSTEQNPKQQGSKATDSPQDAPESIQRWIEQLGSDQYSERESARNRLQALGPAALDQIRLNVHHPDPEVASQCKFFLRSNQLQSAWTDDSFETRKIIERYSVAQPRDKLSLIKELGALDDNAGVLSLCRIARFDPNAICSKNAAMELLRLLMPTSDPESNPLSKKGAITPKNKEFASLILKEMGPSQAPGAQWLAAAFAPLTPEGSQDFDIQSFAKFIQNESELIEKKSPDSNLSTLKALCTFGIKQSALNPGFRPQGLAFGREYFRLAANESNQFSDIGFQELVDFFEWAIDVGIPELVPEKYEALVEMQPQDDKQEDQVFNKLFVRKKPLIMSYLLAESLARQGNQAAADAVSKLALERKEFLLKGNQVTPVSQPSEKDPAKVRFDFDTFDPNSERLFVAQQLISKGYFPWAEAELRALIQSKDDSTQPIAIQGMAVLASMLHELDRDGDAAEVFEKLMHRYDNEKMFQMQIDVFPFEIPSNYHLYLANHLAKENKVQEARKHYFDSIQLSPSNVDALIGLSKLPEDASEKRLRMEAQSQIVNDMRKEIASRDRDLRIAGQRIVLFEKQRLANELNSLAWLITNTEGDQKEALLMSRKACKLAPDRSAYWDTLAHAYEKNGYFESAYRSQLKAIELEPNQPSLIRALKRFREKAQSETQPTP